MQTRRSVFALAGGVAAAAAVIPLKPALAALGVVPDTSKASPALRDAIRALGDASDALKAARAATEADKGKVTQWEAGNPKPTSKRGIKRWDRKRHDYWMSTAREGWKTEARAAEQFRAAQFAVATIQPQNADDLILMAAASMIYDVVRAHGERSAAIGFQVAMSYLRLYGPIGGMTALAN